MRFQISNFKFQMGMGLALGALVCLAQPPMPTPAATAGISNFKSEISELDDGDPATNAVPPVPAPPSVTLAWSIGTNSNVGTPFVLVQVSTNLTNWTDLGKQPCVSGDFTMVDTNGYPMAFYRAMTVNSQLVVTNLTAAVTATNDVDGVDGMDGP